MLLRAICFLRSTPNMDDFWYPNDREEPDWEDQKQLAEWEAQQNTAREDIMRRIHFQQLTLLERIEPVLDENIERLLAEMLQVLSLLGSRHQDAALQELRLFLQWNQGYLQEIYDVIGTQDPGDRDAADYIVRTTKRNLNIMKLTKKNLTEFYRIYRNEQANLTPSNRLAIGMGFHRYQPKPVERKIASWDYKIQELTRSIQKFISDIEEFWTTLLII